MTPVTTKQADYLATNLSYHQRAYRSGYGIQYPEGHVVRCYHRVLRHELGLDGTHGENLLDFGCGTGTHCAFFGSKGFNVYGVDADETAVRACQERFPAIAGHFEVVDPKPPADRRLFDVDFDMVLSNQVLYYLSNTDLRACVDGLHAQVRPGGVFIATMMAEHGCFHDFAEPADDGLWRVNAGPLTGPQPTYINFTRSPDELCRRFEPFMPLHVGYYDFAVDERDGSSLHYLFIGRKG